VCGATRVALVCPFARRCLLDALIAPTGVRRESTPIAAFPAILARGALRVVRVARRVIPGGWLDRKLRLSEHGAPGHCTAIRRRFERLHLQVVQVEAQFLHWSFGVSEYIE